MNLRKLTLPARLSAFPALGDTTITVRTMRDAVVARAAWLAGVVAGSAVTYPDSAHNVEQMTRAAWGDDTFGPSFSDEPRSAFVLGLTLDAAAAAIPFDFAGELAPTGCAEITDAGRAALEAPALEIVSPAPRAETALEEAGRLVYGDRGTAYGHPIDDYERVGRMWGAMLGIPDIDPRIACAMMVAVKLSREVHKPKRDNRVDVAGYAECVDMIASEQARRAAGAA